MPSNSIGQQPLKFGFYITNNGVRYFRGKWFDLRNGLAIDPQVSHWANVEIN